MFRAKYKAKQFDKRAISSRLGQITLYGTFGLLMFGPLAFGAVEPWSIFVVEAGSLVLLLIWFAKQWIDGELHLRWNPLYLPIAAFGLLATVQWIFRVTAYAHDTRSQILLYAAYAMLCFLSGHTMVKSSQARQIAVMFVVYGSVVAGLALLQGIAPNGKLYWLRQPRLGGWIYGPYVNHNHYAGLMELLVPIPLVLSLTHLVHQKARIGAGIAAAIMTGTVFLSGSRGGMLAILTELAVLGVLTFRQRRGIRLAIGTAAFCIVLLGILTWLGGKELTTRVSSIGRESRTEISGGTRLTIDRDAIRMFRMRPVLGWGLGTFPVVYPEFRSFYTNFFVNEAHNDYLQLLDEMGIVGFGLMLWFVILVYRGALSKIGRWSSDVNGAVALACMLGTTGILVHSLFDFNLQIPANAAIYYVMCAIAAAPPLAQRTMKRRPVLPTDSDVVERASEVV